MKRGWLFVIGIILLAGCMGSAAPGGGKCREGICVKIEVAEPVRWGEPVTVTITVKTETDFPKLGVSLYFIDRSIIVEGPAGWEANCQEGTVWEGGAAWLVEARAGQIMTFVRKIWLPATEESFQILANATTPQGFRVTDSVRISLTRKGGKVYYSGTPVPTRPLSGWAGGRVITSEGVSCDPGPCFTIRVAEPVRWGEPVRATLQVEGKRRDAPEIEPPFPVEPALVARLNRKDLYELGLTFSSPDPSVQIIPGKGEFREEMRWPAGNGVWWVADVLADSVQEYTFLVKFPPKEGVYYLYARSFDLVIGDIGFDWVAVHLSRDGGEVYSPNQGRPYPSWLFPSPTPMVPPSPTPFLSPLLTPPAYSPISPLPTPGANP
jgi:hypothetical protein